MSEQTKNGEKRKGLIGEIWNGIKELDREERYSTFGRMAGYLAPTVAAFSVDPALGVAVAVPSILSAVVTEVDNEINGRWGENQFESLFRAGLPVAAATGAVVGGIASGDMNTVVGVGLGTLGGGLVALGTGISGAIGHFGGKAIGTIADAIDSLRGR